MRTPKLVAVVIVTTIAAFSGYLVLQEDTQDEVERSHGDAEPPRVEHSPGQSDFATLRREVQQLRGDIERSGIPQVQQTELRSPGDHEAPTDPDVWNDHRRYAQVQLLTDVINAEDTDEDWAVGQEWAVREFLQREEMGETRLTSLECRSTLCRMEVTFSSADARDAFAASVVGSDEFAGGGTAHDLTPNDGEYEYVVFVAREGYPLPQHPGGS